MALKIVRNDITKMNTQAVVNTANPKVMVGSGCDLAIYKAAGMDELLSFRRDNIGEVPEGEAFITPGFGLSAEYIIHAVSPRYAGGNRGEEMKLRSCYRKSLELAGKEGISSIAFPLISTGGFRYPKEEGMRIAVDEINTFLLKNEMEVFLVVFDDYSTAFGRKIYPGLESYIDQNYVDEAGKNEYSEKVLPKPNDLYLDERFLEKSNLFCITESIEGTAPDYVEYQQENLERMLSERLKHLSDTFSEYLIYLIKENGMTNAEVWKGAIVDKKVFSKIKNNVDYHPTKLTALCLCIGARLNLDETKDLLARAGYALSPCDKTDIIFSYFIENEIYDMIELDIQLEEHGLPCVIQ